MPSLVWISRYNPSVYRLLPNAILMRRAPAARFIRRGLRRDIRFAKVRATIVALIPRNERRCSRRCRAVRRSFLISQLIDINF